MSQGKLDFHLKTLLVRKLEFMMKVGQREHWIAMDPILVC